MIMLVAAGHAHAQPPEEQLTLTDDLVAAVGLRPISDGRLEVLAATGSDATHQAALRATDRIGAWHGELTGNALASDQLGDRTDAGARIEHTTERDRVRAFGTFGTTYVPTTMQSFTTDSQVATYGAAWTAWRARGRLELEASGEHLTLRDDRDTGALDLEASALNAHAGFTSRRLQAFDLDHELGGGFSVTRASADATDAELDPQMPHMPLPPKQRRGNSRFLRAYIIDTIRVIESLDISGGFVFEHWRWLSSMPPLSASAEEQMNAEAPEMIGFLLGPRLGALYRVTPDVAIAATAYRKLRAPSWQQLVRPVQNGSVVTAPTTDLRAETVTGGELGPTLTAGPLEARAVAYYNDIESPLAAVTTSETLRETTNLGRAREAGIDAAANLRLGAPWLASVGYTFTATRVIDGGAHADLAGMQLAQAPRHRATAMVAFDEPRIVTLAGVVRYVGRRFEDDRNATALRPFAVVDAMAMRKLTHGLAGFVAVENVLDRRYVSHVAGLDTAGAPRMVHVGLRLDSARW